MAKRQQKWPRAICTNCGIVYLRSAWRHSTQSGKVRCGVRTCDGRLWIVPNKTIGWAMNKLDRELRRRHAQLQMIGELCE